MGSRQGTPRNINRRLRACALAALFVCVALPSSALAGTVNLNGGEMDYVAADGEQNTITVTGENGHITVRDQDKNVQIVPFSEPGCTQDATDTVTCPATTVSVDANDMDDTVDASASAVPGSESGSSGGVIESGGDGTDHLIGGPYTDTLEGDSGADTLDGGDGNDFITGGADNDVEDGGPGDDSLEASGFGTLGDDLVKGGPGDDTFAQPNRPPGGMSDGADTFEGGDGIDTANYQTSTGDLTVSLDGLPNDGYTGEGDNIEGDVENLVGGPGADTLTGSDGSNAIDGGPGKDTITALGGDDTITGGEDESNDTIDGGPGNDALSGGPGDDTLTAGDGNDTVVGNNGNDLESGGDGTDTMAGDTGDDTMDGGAGDDVMHGGDLQGAGADGKDTINGGPGPDHLSGDGGDDTLDGGPGGDDLAGGPGEDIADYASQPVPLTVTIDGKANDGGPGEKDNVTQDVEDVNGGSGETTVDGNGSANKLTGGSGEDYADGLAGSDTLTGGGASDTLRSRDGVPDTVDCGPGPYDFAIADAKDVVKPSCEEVDDGHRKPVAGRRVVVKPAGMSLVKRAHVRRFVPLSDRVGLHWAPRSTRSRPASGSPPPGTAMRVSPARFPAACSY